MNCPNVSVTAYMCVWVCLHPQLSLPLRFPVTLLYIHHIKLFYMEHHYIFAGQVEGSFLDPDLEKLKEKPSAIKRSNPEPIGFAIHSYFRAHFLPKVKKD